MLSASLNKTFPSFLLHIIHWIILFNINFKIIKIKEIKYIIISVVKCYLYKRWVQRLFLVIYYLMEKQQQETAARYFFKCVITLMLECNFKTFIYMWQALTSNIFCMTFSTTRHIRYTLIHKSVEWMTLRAALSWRWPRFTIPESSAVSFHWLWFTTNADAWNNRTLLLVARYTQGHSKPVDDV